MRVRSLQTYLLNQKLVQSDPLSQLRGKRIGVDAIFWLRTLSNLKDPLADAIGGLPPAVYGVLDRCISILERLEIKMVFVFQGMQPRSHMLFSSQMHQQMDAAWRQAINGNFLAAQQGFAQATSRINSDFVYVVARYLQAKGCETFQAPYFAASQLSYFVQQGILDAVFGPPALLLFGVPCVITGMQIEEGTFEWVKLQQLLNTWQVKEEQLIDACLLAGTEYCLTFPYLNLAHFHGERQQFQFGTAIDFIKQAPLIGYMQEMRLDHAHGYCVCKTLIKFPLALQLDGRVLPVPRNQTTNIESGQPETEEEFVPVNEIAVPEDFHRIVGLSLPSSVFFLMSRHILSRKLPSVLALGEWLDSSHPTVDSIEYRDLLKDVREYRRRALGLIAMRLHEAFRTKTIKFSRYNCHSAPSASVELLPDCYPGLPWSFTASQLTRELARQGTTKLSFRFCLTWHSYEASQNRSLLAAVDQRIGPVADLNDSRVFEAIIYLTMLENLGYFTREGGFTVFGSALTTTAVEFEEETLLALELMKYGVLMGDPLESPPDRPFPEGVCWLRNKNNESKSNEENILLLSRVVSLTPMNLSEKNLWLAPIDFDLAAFHSIVKVLKRTFRQLCEASVSNLLLRDLSLVRNLSIDQFSPKKPRFPIFLPPRNCMGIVFKHFLEFQLDTTSSASITNVEALKNWQALEAELNSTYHCCLTPVADILKAIRFWLEVLQVIDMLSRNVTVGHLKAEMDTAHRFLLERIISVGLHLHPTFQGEAFASIRAEITQLIARSAGATATYNMRSVEDSRNTNHAAFEATNHPTVESSA